MTSTMSLREIHSMIHDLTGIEGTLVGGCARDTLMGKAPRDYDYAIYGPDDEREAFRLLANISARLSAFGIKSVIKAAYGFGEYVTNNFNDKWLGHLAFEHQGTKVDVLITAHKRSKLLALFDCNMNRVYYSHKHDCVVGTIPDVLEFRNEVTPERSSYMRAKFNAYKEGIINAS